MNWKKKGINGDLALAYEGDIMIVYAMCPLPVCYFWKQKWGIIYPFIGCHLLLANIHWLAA